MHMHMPMSCICVYMYAYVYVLCSPPRCSRGYSCAMPVFTTAPHVARTMPVTYYCDSKVLILCLYALCLYLVLWL